MDERTCVHFEVGKCKLGRKCLCEHFAADGEKVRKEIKMNRIKVTMYFDGNVKDNGDSNSKGEAVYVLHCNGKEKVVKKQVFGVTNNTAEYMGLLFGLSAIHGHRKHEINLEIIGDSKLVINQIQDKWKCRKEHLKPLCAEAKEELKKFNSWKADWVPRNENVAGEI